MQKLSKSVLVVALLSSSVFSCASTNPPENIPITVEPPPNMELEEIVVANYPYMEMRPTGRSNNFGNPIYTVVMYSEGKVIHRVDAVTGRAHTQNKNRDVAGTEAPLPNGKYLISRKIIPGTHPEVGGLFLPITPVFRTSRSELGFHVDPSYNTNITEDGTSGCIGTTTIIERDILFNYVKKYNPRYLKVDI